MVSAKLRTLLLGLSTAFLAGLFIGSPAAMLAEPFFDELFNRLGIDTSSWVPPMLEVFSNDWFRYSAFFVIGAAIGAMAHLWAIKFDRRRSATGSVYVKYHHVLADIEMGGQGRLNIYEIEDRASGISVSQTKTNHFVWKGRADDDGRSAFVCLSVKILLDFPVAEIALFFDLSSDRTSGDRSRSTILLDQVNEFNSSVQFYIINLTDHNVVCEILGQATARPRGSTKTYFVDCDFGASRNAIEFSPNTRMPGDEKILR